MSLGAFISQQCNLLLSMQEAPTWYNTCGQDCSFLDWMLWLYFGNPRRRGRNHYGLEDGHWRMHLLHKIFNSANRKQVPWKFGHMQFECPHQLGTLESCRSLCSTFQDYSCPIWIKTLQELNMKKGRSLEIGTWAAHDIYTIHPTFHWFSRDGNTPQPDNNILFPITNENYRNLDSVVSYIREELTSFQNCYNMQMPYQTAPKCPVP